MLFKEGQRGGVGALNHHVRSFLLETNQGEEDMPWSQTLGPAVSMNMSDPTGLFLAPVSWLVALFGKAVETAGGRAYPGGKRPIGSEHSRCINPWLLVMFCEPSSSKVNNRLPLTPAASSTWVQVAMKPSANIFPQVPVRHPWQNWWASKDRASCLIGDT